MKTDLAYINDTIESELALEERDELPPPRTGSAPVERLRGFMLPAEVTQPIHDAAVLDRRKSTIGEYRKNAGELRIKLMKAGIEPLAVLPRSAWGALCESAGLYLMAPDPNGNVNFEGSLFTKFRSRWGLPEKVACVVVPLLMAVAMIYPLLGYLWRQPWDRLGQLFTFGAIVGVSMIAATLTYNWLHWRCDRNCYQRRARQYLAGKTWAQILRDLSPSRKLWTGHVNCEIALPDPPADVARTILALQKSGFNIRVAAEADAISPIGGIKKLFDTEYDAMIRREEAARAAARADPIIYVCHGQDNVWIEGRPNDAVAIVAQYGDFPIEREVVDRLVKSRKII